MPQASQLHIDQALTNIASAYGLNKSFVAPWLAPTVNVTKDSGSYFVMGFEELHVFDDLITEKTEAKEVDWFTTTASFQTVGRALKTFVGDKSVAVADAVVDPLATSVRKLTAMLQLNREVRCATAVNAAIGSYTTSLSHAWDTASTATPITNLRTAASTIYARSGIWPNTIVMPRSVVPKVVASAEYRDYIKYVAPADTQFNSEIASKIAGMDVVLTDAQKSTDDLKTTLFTGTMPTIGGVWLYDSVYVLYKNPNPSITDSGFMYHFGLTPFRVRRYREEKRGIGGGTWIQVEYEGVDKVVNGLLIHELDEVVA